MITEEKFNTIQENTNDLPKNTQNQKTWLEKLKKEIGITQDAPEQQLEVQRSEKKRRRTWSL